MRIDSNGTDQPVVVAGRNRLRTTSRPKVLATLLAILALVPGCTVVTDFDLGGLVGLGSLPVNEGPRLDLVTDFDGVFQEQLRAGISMALTSQSDTASWFIAVDRVIDPASTLIVSGSVNDTGRDTSRSGSPKYGYTTIFITYAGVTLSLVDVASGRVIATESLSLRATSRDRYPSTERTVQEAASRAFRELVRRYAGG